MAIKIAKPNVEGTEKTWSNKVKQGVIREYNLKGDDLEAFNTLLKEEDDQKYFDLECQVMTDHPIAAEAAAEFRERWLNYREKMKLEDVKAE